MSDFTIRTRKFKQNPLLGRKQFVLDIIHPSLANVSKKDLATKLAQMYKVTITSASSSSASRPSSAAAAARDSASSTRTLTR